MARMQNPNLEILERAVNELGELADEMVFVGGCATGLLITDSAAPPIRVTMDVDAIVQVVSITDYWGLSERLREKGFAEDVSDGAPMCRWVSEGVILDVMPTDENILGFGNQWYSPAAKHAELKELPLSGQTVRLISSPYFLMTKLNAFDGRGGGDYLLSHDIEDLIAVLDGRLELFEEVLNAPEDLKAALAERFNVLLQDNRFLEAVPGHLPSIASSPARLSILMSTMQKIAGLV